MASIKRRRLGEPVRKRVMYKYRYHCNHCKGMVDDLHELDHIIPLWANGKDAEENLQLLCYTCHGRKTREECELRTQYQLAQSMIKHKSEMVCWRCSRVVSVYFTHRCNGPPNAQNYEYYSASTLATWRKPEQRSTRA